MIHTPVVKYVSTREKRHKKRSQAIQQIEKRNLLSSSTREGKENTTPENKPKVSNNPSPNPSPQINLPTPHPLAPFHQLHRSQQEVKKKSFLRKRVPENNRRAPFRLLRLLRVRVQARPLRTLSVSIVGSRKTKGISAALSPG
jgi:hypothetical protein